MVEVACSLISAVAVIISAILAAKVTRTEKLSEQRLEEARLQLRMLNANSQLTVGVAMALKHGHCNGEVEAGLKAVNEASKEYEQFLEEIAIQHLMW